MSALIDVLSAGILGVFGLPGHVEIIIIALVILLLFGGKKLPELARGLARGLRLFKDELKGVRTDVQEVGKDVKDISKNIQEDVEEVDQSQSSGDRPDQQDQT